MHWFGGSDNWNTYVEGEGEGAWEDSIEGCREGIRAHTSEEIKHIWMRLFDYMNKVDVVLD